MDGPAIGFGTPIKGPRQCGPAVCGAPASSPSPSCAPSFGYAAGGSSGGRQTVGRTRPISRPPDAVRTADFRSHQTPDVARVIVRAAGPDLTERERVVPVWMAEGPNKAPIAGRLDVSPSAEHRPERRGSQTHDASNTPRPHPSAGECLSPPLGGGTDWLR